MGPVREERVLDVCTFAGNRDASACKTFDPEEGTRRRDDDSGDRRGGKRSPQTRSTREIQAPQRASNPSRSPTAIPAIQLC
ncbi:hypothetical protein SCOR_01180 [Sulfidibacter corallicola]